MAKKEVKKSKKKAAEDDIEENESGLELDDAFAGSDDVGYGEAKPFKAKKNDIEEEGIDGEELEKELGGIEEEINNSAEKGEIKIKASKPLSKIKKGDKIRIDGTQYEVDSHYVLMDHKNTKEMAIELFDKNDKDYQLRYFDDQAESTLEFYGLQEIMYFKKPFVKIEW